MGHFGDVPPSQSLGYVLKKLNPKQQKQAIQEQNDLSYHERTHNRYNLNKHTKRNLNLTCKNVRTAHVCVCAYHCVQLSYTAQHRIVRIIFPLIRQTSIRAQMLYVMRRWSYKIFSTCCWWIEDYELNKISLKSKLLGSSWTVIHN